LNAHRKRMPWSKYACASFDDVVTLRRNWPRPSKSCAPCAHSAIVVGTGEAFGPALSR
jgi:hypothetical protein